MSVARFSGMSEPVLDVTYILPIKASQPVLTTAWIEYLRWLSANVREVLAVDSSSPEIFRAHAASWGGIVRHVALEPQLATPMGKVGNVLTGVRLASHERLIIADDDVHYDNVSLRRVTQSLGNAEVVRPQNYFDPLPWHARWDTGRMLLNRMTGGDWPGTLGVLRSSLLATEGYDGNAMFENLELIRTVLAAGGREAVLLDAYVLRLPSSTRHFWSQRIRQAYDEMARPLRLLLQLAILPGAIFLTIIGRWMVLAILVVAVVALAELGRRRAGGTRFFPFTASLFAPVWLAERAVCSWLALFSRVFLGGVPYRGTVLRLAANSMRHLRQRHGTARKPGIRAATDHTDRYQSA